jgi:hypothetical protein
VPKLALVGGGSRAGICPVIALATKQTGAAVPLPALPAAKAWARRRGKVTQNASRSRPMGTAIYTLKPYSGRIVE